VDCKKASERKALPRQMEKPMKSENREKKWMPERIRGKRHQDHPDKAVSRYLSGH
jgi:hypothetical protein